MMIRVFRGIEHDGKQKEFEKFFFENSIPLVKSQSGLISATVGKPMVSSTTEFLMITVWKDLEYPDRLCR